MPGFGKGPFGKNPFGEWKWSRQVLFDLVPELYRENDPDGLFEAFIESLRPQFDKQRRLIRDFGELRAALLVRTQFDEIERLRLGPVLIPQGAVEQQGIDGSVNALFQFVAPSGRFRSTDEGKELIVRGSSVVGNNRKVTIITVLDLSTVVTDPQLKTDAGPLKWELREKVSASTDHFTVEVRGGDVSRIAPGWLLNDGKADFELLARRQFDARGLLQFQTEREGTDGIISGDQFFQAESANFTPKDVGKHLSISGSSIAENNRKFEIVSIDETTSPPTVGLRGGFLSPGTDLFWALLPFPQLDLNGQALPLGVVEQEGEDGSLTAASDEFVSATGVFASEDVGKILRIFKSTVDPNPVEDEIVSVLDANTVQLTTTSGSTLSDLVWELRTKTLVGDAERLGADMEISDVDDAEDRRATVLSPSAQFVPADEGHEIRISGSEIEDNNDTYLIESVLDSEQAVILRGNPPDVPISGAAVTVDDGPLTWAVVNPRSSALVTEFGQLSKVNVRAESLIKSFAPDFGIEIDTQESENRQRGWVRHVNTWLDKKGHEESYQILGAISGFDVTVTQLYRVDASFVDFFSAGDLFEVGETDEGRFGTEGALEVKSGGLQFRSDEALFRASDVDLSIRVGNAADSANNKVYTIAETLDANTVVLRPTDLLSGSSEFGIGGISTDPTLTWSLLRFFANKPPEIPRFDDINADAMGEYIDTNPPSGDEFTVDKYCWETDWAAFVEITINTVTNIEGNRFLVNATPTTGVSDLDTIPHPDPGTSTRVDLPVWAITDSAGNRFVVETLPDVAGGAWEFEVVADPAVPPATGVGTIDYECLNLPSCEYCGAAAVAVVIEEGSVAEEEGVAVERVLERVLRRLTQHPKPAHVRIIPIFKRILEATLDLTAEFEGPTFITTLYAPVTVLFDDVDADAYPLDTALLAEVESTRTIWEGGLSD